jgi:hypothetical protein
MPNHERIEQRNIPQGGLCLKSPLFGLFIGQNAELLGNRAIIWARSNDSWAAAPILGHVFQSSRISNFLRAESETSALAVILQQSLSM